MSSGARRVRATFWLLEAPDSLARQSRREPDGTGLGFFDMNGTPERSRQALPAFEDPELAREAKEVESSTFIAHVRYASTGSVALRNTHPFCQQGRLFAHNGVIEGLDRIEAALGPQRATVEGETDSERFFALINQHAERLGDLDAGIVSAARWLAEHVPLFALNMVLITSARLWAFRYPETHPLYVLERRAGGVHGDRHLEHASSAGRVRVRAGELRETPCVVVATEPMDEDHGWRLLRPGELLRVDPDLAVSARVVLPEPPVYRLSLSDLEPHAAASQSVDPSRRASEAPS